MVTAPTRITPSKLGLLTPPTASRSPGQHRVLALRLGEWMLTPEAGPVLDQIEEAFYALADDWTLMKVNRAAERYWGRSREQLLGKPFWQSFPQAVGSEPYNRHFHCAKHRVPWEFTSTSPVIGALLDIRIEPLRSGLAVCFRPRGTATNSLDERHPDGRTHFRTLKLVRDKTGSEPRVKATIAVMISPQTVICTCGGCGSVIAITGPETKLDVLIECATCAGLNTLD